MNKLTISQLLYYNVHIGHKMKNVPLFVAWMIYGKRQNLWIINIKLTLYLLSLSIKLVKNIIKNQGPFWFVNQDKNFSRFLELIGIYCGEIAVGGMWINGMITNYINVGLSYLLKKNLTYKLSWPRGVFISSAFFSKSALSECNKAKIACIGIFDTNFKASGTKIAIPGNDDSSDCILFYNNFFGNLVIKEKFFQIVWWFTNILKLKIKGNFSLDFISNNEVFFLKNLLESYFNLFKLTLGKVEGRNIIYSFNLDISYKNFKSYKNFFWITKMFVYGNLFNSKKKVFKMIKLRRIKTFYFYNLKIKKKYLKLIKLFIFYKIILKKSFKKRYLKWIKLYNAYKVIRKNIKEIYFKRFYVI